jgi:hypothetical protein
MYVNEKNLAKLKEFKKHSMSQFADREIKLFRSFDSQLVQKYHGNRENPGWYELIMMNYKYGEPQYLIKYPYTNFFVELASSGASMNGVHEHINCSNPIKDYIDPYYYEDKLSQEKVEIFRFGERVMLMVDTFRHDFLDEVVGEDILNQEYIKIPEFREIAYAFHSSDLGKYLIVDQSKYNFQYETMRLFFGDIKAGFNILEIKNFVRYRDGGTTSFTFIYEGKDYVFFNPSPLKQDNSPTTLNESKLVEIPDYVKIQFIKDMNILYLNKTKPNGTDN